MDTEPAPSFGAMLRQYRERAGLTQEALAAQAGLTSTAISALERGQRRHPYPHTAQALAGALKLHPEQHSLLIQLAPRSSIRSCSTPSMGWPS